MNLHTLIQDIYTPAGIITSDITCEAESKDYYACRFKLMEHRVIFRVAKTTPAKIGQFVTLWKRSQKGAAIAPFAGDDPVDFVIVHTADAGHLGQFIFNRDTLIEHGIFSSPENPGKRAMRVYPPWHSPVARQAVATQRWQLHYFLHLSADLTVDASRLGQLFQL